MDSNATMAIFFEILSKKHRVVHNIWTWPFRLSNENTFTDYEYRKFGMSGEQLETMSNHTVLISRWRVKGCGNL